MSGETEEHQSAWTVDTLYAHFNLVFKLLGERMDRQWQEERRATDIALQAHDEALRVARETSEKAIDSALAAQKEAVSVQAESLKQYDAKQNHWRDSLNDLTKMAMPRSEAEAAIQRAEVSLRDMVIAQQHFITRTELEVGRQADRALIDALSKQVTEMRAATAAAADKVRGIYAALGVAVTLIIAAIAVFNFISAR